MSKNSIGISGIDWSGFPDDATHFKAGLAYRKIGVVWEYFKVDYWCQSSNNDYWFKDALTKEKDLEMDKKEVAKQVRSVDDLELGMFLKSETGNVVVVTRDAWRGNNLKFFSCSNMANAQVAQNGAGKEFYDKFHSWSYTYSGEYTPIIKETEAERKIKELEATIELAQKQLQEYKGMK